MPLTSALRKKYREELERLLYAEIIDLQTPNYSRKLALDLHNIFEPDPKHKNSPLFQPVLTQLIQYRDNPASFVENPDDVDEFLVLFRDSIKQAITYYANVTTYEFTQMARENFLNTKPQRLTLFKPVSKKTSQERYDEAREALSRALNAQFGVLINTTGPGYIMLDRINRLVNRKNIDDLTTLLIAVNAVVVHPSEANRQDCLDALKKVDGPSRQLEGVLYILLGILIITVVVLAILMSAGAFSALGIPVFPDVAIILIAELGTIFGSFATMLSIATGIEILVGDDDVNRIHRELDNLDIATEILPPDLDIEDPDPVIPSPV